MTVSHKSKKIDNAKIIKAGKDFIDHGLDPLVIKRGKEAEEFLKRVGLPEHLREE
jgi:hypothetical protein